MSTKRMEQYIGIKEELLVLVENADLVVIDKVVVKSKDKNPYIYMKVQEFVTMIRCI